MWETAKDMNRNYKETKQIFPIETLLKLMDLKETKGFIAETLQKLILTRSFSENWTVILLKKFVKFPGRTIHRHT